jgi:hypothetical protein
MSEINVPEKHSWTHIMLMILRENVDSMTDKELSQALGKPVTAIAQKIRELQLLRPRPVKVPKPVKLRIKKERPLTEKQIRKQIDDRKKEEERKRRNDMERWRHESKARNPNNRVVQSKEVDYSELRTVRIDSKTWIYVKPGEDIEKLKKKYSRTLSKDGLSKIEG